MASRSPGWLRTRRPTPRQEGWRWPAEWERHEGTWFAWPHDPTTWGEGIEEVEEAFTLFAWAVGLGETVHVLVRHRAMEARVDTRLAAAGVRRFVLHRVATVDAWIRDYGPIVVVRGRGVTRERLALDFCFNAWGGKYPELEADTTVPARLVRRHGLRRRTVDLVLEGGSIEGNGKGTLLTSEQCLLNPNRNPALCRAEIEANLRESLDARHVLWLGDGIAGDDTDGHVDDVARFVGPRTVVVAREDDPQDENHAVLEDAWRRLKAMADQDGSPLEVIGLPMPPPILGPDGGRLPASYANFYVANAAVVVPTFGHPSDGRALRVLRRVFPKRRVVGIRAERIVEGLGAFHCLSQQLPGLTVLTTIDQLTVLRDHPKRVLSVFAHPDDESYGCAGALARAGADGDTAAVHLCLTSGEAYSVLRNEGLSPEEIARVREERMRRVAARTGIDALLLPRLPDGRLAYVPLERLGDVVGAAIDAFDPQVVIGSDPRGVNAHPDHIAAHWAVRRALEGRPPRRFGMIVYLQDLADAVKPRLIFPTPEDQIDVVLSLSPAEVDAKEDCLRTHEALVTLKEGGPADLILRPAIERYDLFGEAFDPPLTDLFP